MSDTQNATNETGTELPTVQNQTDSMTSVTPEATHVEAVTVAVQDMNVGEYVETADKDVITGVNAFWDTVKADFKNVELKVENFANGVVRFFKQKISDADTDVADAEEAVNADAKEAKDDVLSAEQTVAQDTDKVQGEISTDASAVEAEANKI